jgi:WD40 repeat protein
MQGVRFAPDGRTVISVGDDQKLQIWDVASRTLRSSFSGHEGRVFGPAFSRDGRTVYTSGLDGTVIAWDLDGSRSLGRPFDVVTPRDPSIVPMSYLARAIAPDGRTIAVGTMNDTVELFDARTLRRERTITVFTPGQLRRLQRPPGDLSPGIIDSVAFGGDGRTIAAVGDAGVAELLDVRRGVAVRTLAHRSAFGWSNWVSSNRDGTRFAVSSDDGTVAVYTGNGRLLRLLRVTHSTPAHPVPIREAAFSPDGSRLAVARDGGTVDVWSLPDARRLWHRRIDRWTATTARFSPDARLIAAGGSQRGNVTLLDATTGRLVAPPFNTDAGYVVSAEFDPTGQLLATGGTDGAVRLWDVRTRKQYGADLPSRAPAAWSTATFYPDGRRLLGNWATGAAAVWDIDPADLARRACAVAGRTLTRAEWTSFLPGRPYRPACSASR